MRRRTKIIATLGPATDPLRVAADGGVSLDTKVMDALVEAGVDLARVSFSHGDYAQHQRQIEAIRNSAWSRGRQVGLIMDLMGPKIRIGRFRDREILLPTGAKFSLDMSLGGADGEIADGTSDAVGVTYKELTHDVKRGDTLLLNGGLVELWVEEVADSRVLCRVVVGGLLSDHRALNRKNGGLTAKALTPKDLVDIEFAAIMEADYLAVSFAQSADVIHDARRLFREVGGKGDIIVKIERAEAVKKATLEALIEAADAVMIARGDLGVEIGDAELPAYQKQIIRKTRDMNKVVITATQMMESMIACSVPTRAEVFDVANAVIDGTDAVMLSAETALGKFPAETVAAMARVCLSAERHPRARKSKHRISTHFAGVDEAVALSTMYAANHLGVSAIAALTESGSTARWMSRVNSSIPIFALTPHVFTRRRVTLYRGVYPVSMPLDINDHELVIAEVIDEMLRQGSVRVGDLVIITKGDKMGKLGGTNTMQIVRVGERQL